MKSTNDRIIYMKIHSHPYAQWPVSWSARHSLHWMNEAALVSNSIASVVDVVM